MQEHNFNTYTTVPGDTWDLVAFKIFGDERFTGQLLKSNPSLTKLVILPPGLIIKLPKLNNTDENMEVSPPWL
ncbi:tail protein X [Fusobacterium hominis]|uniref:Tail protein X n=1 Tax=Fusobacterium hominis TaxID=2764326 RepID=A0A7G9GXI7_9FUSO|nr:tail protein X [Fusobacterium hominis]